MSRYYRRAWRRLRHLGASFLGLPGALLRFAIRLRYDAALRERTLARAVFAGIFAFAIGSFDFLMTGGPDLIQGPAAEAQAAPLQSRILAYASPITETPVSSAAEDAAADAETNADEVMEDASVSSDDLLGGPDTVLAAWREEGPGAADLASEIDSVDGAEAIVLDSAAPFKNKSPIHS